LALSLNVAQFLEKVTVDTVTFELCTSTLPPVIFLPLEAVVDRPRNKAQKRAGKQFTMDEAEFRRMVNRSDFKCIQFQADRTLPQSVIIRDKDQSGSNH